MSCIHYKFKSSLDYRTVTFDGLHLSLCELKRMIFDRERIRASDFDLLVTNAQTNEVYEADTAVVVRNSSVIVSRIPVQAQRKLPKIWDRGMDGVVPKQVTTETPSLANSAVNCLSAYSEAMSEEEKLEKMQEESTFDYDPSRYQRKHLIATGVPPANYICNRCGQPGHWIKMCPSSNIKRTTGIPKGELMETTADDPQAMLTAAGTYAVPFLHKQAFLMGKADKRFGDYRVGPVFPAEQKKQSLPHELLCSLCDNLLRDASLIPCCGYSYCDECIRHCLLESDDRQCPHCHENGISPTALIPNGKLREAVKAFQTSMNNVSLFTPVEELASKITPAITASSHSKLKVNLAHLISDRAVVVSSEQQTAPSAAPVDATTRAISTSANHGSTETKPIVSAVPFSVGQQRMPPSSMYPSVAPALPTNPYLANFSQMPYSMQNYPPMHLPATAYPRGAYGGFNMSQLVGGMYPSGACQVPEAYMRFHLKNTMHMSAEPTTRDGWEEFLSRKDRRRMRYRSKSPVSRTSKRQRSRSSSKRSPYRKYHHAKEKSFERRESSSRASTESPHHRRERAEPLRKSDISPRREASEADQLTRDNSGPVSLELQAGDTDIDEILWESVSSEYGSTAVKSPPKLRDGSSESVGNAGKTSPHQIVTRDRGDGRTTMDGTGTSDTQEPSVGRRCFEKSGERLNEELWEEFSSSPATIPFESFGDEVVEEDGRPEANAYESMDTHRRSPPPLRPTEGKHRPDLDVCRDDHASMMPQASYLERNDRSSGKAVAGRSERHKKSRTRKTVSEESSNPQCSSEILNDKRVLDSYDHTEFVTLEEESCAVARQEARVFEAPCSSAPPSIHRSHKERRKEKKARHSKKTKKEKKHKKKKSKDKQSSDTKKNKRKHRYSHESKLLTIAEIPHVLDSTEWVVRESSISDVYPLEPASSTGLSAAAVEMEPAVSKRVSSSSGLRSDLPKSVDKPLPSKVGVPSKNSVSSRPVAAPLSDKLQSKNSGEHSKHRRGVDEHKRRSRKDSTASIDRQQVKETYPERKVHKSEARSNKEGKSTSDTHRHGHSGHGSSHSREHLPVGSSRSNNSQHKEAAKKTEKKATSKSCSHVTGSRKLLFTSERNK
ncbi:retinoblastoma binding protein 6 [Trichuris trichiura]|uniref:Retinoblastoma binding protein 6 n=1 Tax=Trichuris trichiura TaxID=36087 RepID=A0A077Z480_TRITR|nr:retinoblastoma binding protein 6 [Trichuris trichiura]